MDETDADEVVTVGQRLREAREAKGISIEDVAAQTRIPTRHLASLEASDWEKLPAATYSIGFAKNYASAVGLDRNEIGEQLRAEMGGSRPATVYPEVFEAVDPARTMPKGLVIGALVLLVLVVLALTWLNNRSLEAEEPVAEAANDVAPVTNEVAPELAPTTSQTVVLTATDAVWIEVNDGSAVLKQGHLAPGDRYEVPASAVAPVLTTGKPEALSIAVGSQQAPAIGEPGRTVSGVSLKPADLLRSGAATSPATTAQAAPTTTPTQSAPRRRAAPVTRPVETSNPLAPSANTAASAPSSQDDTTDQQ